MTEAFQAVCHSRPDVLSCSIVFDHLNSQQAAFSVKLFSPHVEVAIHEEGFVQSADLLAWCNADMMLVTSMVFPQ